MNFHPTYPWIYKRFWNILLSVFEIMTFIFFNLQERGNYTAPCRHLFNMFWLGVNQEHQRHFLLWRDPDWSQICEQPRAEWCAVSGGGPGILWTQDCAGDMVTSVPGNAQLQGLWWEPTHRSYQWHPVSHLWGRLGDCSGVCNKQILWF